MAERFLRYISKIKDPVDFLGLCKLLGVEIVPDKEMEVYLAELLDKFDSKNRKVKKEILRLLKQITK